MDRKREYGGLDWFRLISAILVITIHTSPLLSFGELPDFILTRILARIAVPFFLMISGFFLLPEVSGEPERLYRQIGQLAKLYFAAVVLYAPVMIYSGYFKDDFSVGNLIKDLLINGTFYHLWYLPAAMTGLFLVGLLLRYCKDWLVLLISCILYFFGLLGDSYYGITAMVPWMKKLYDGIFSVSEYTRNGLFFVPLFLMLGYYLGKQADRRSELTRQKAVMGLVISGILMWGEGMTLHYLQWQRHDSMYLLLPVVMVFLFSLLLQWNIRGGKRLNRIAMLVYILHPAMIVAVRLGGKLTGLTRLVVEQSLVHFILVTICSFAAAYLLTLLPFKKEKNQSQNNKRKAQERIR